MSVSRKRPQQNRKKTNLPDRQLSSRPKKNTKKQKKLFDQIIFHDWCKACGICSAFCPKNVIGLDENGVPFIEHPDDCIGCRFCEIHCPDFAITIRKRPSESKGKS